MIKNDIERIIFVTMIVICLIALYISGIEVDAAYNTINELQTEIALIEKHNKNLELELQDAKNLKETLSTASYIGEFEVTYYCSCEKCCGKTDGITYTGTQATEGRTIAVDPNIIPLGSKVIIDGQTYIAEDIGGTIKNLRVDIYVSDHQKALNLGRTTKEVFLLVG
jgi:3D (Asp-Asp-Asp) domain-containing protein